nr:hypothetical protein CFP56_57790 [Quercus suber]
MKNLLRSSASSYPNLHPTTQRCMPPHKSPDSFLELVNIQSYPLIQFILFSKPFWWEQTKQEKGGEPKKITEEAASQGGGDWQPGSELHTKTLRTVSFDVFVSVYWKLEITQQTLQMDSGKKRLNELGY